LLSTGLVVQELSLFIEPLLYVSNYCKLIGKITQTVNITIFILTGQEKDDQGHVNENETGHVKRAAVIDHAVENVNTEREAGNGIVDANMRNATENAAIDEERVKESEKGRGNTEVVDIKNSMGLISYAALIVNSKYLVYGQS